MTGYEYQLSELKREWAAFKKRLRDVWRALIGKDRVQEPTPPYYGPPPATFFNIFNVKCVDCGHELKVPTLVAKRWDPSMIACVVCGGKYEVKE